MVILTYTPCAGGVALKVGWTLTQVAALLVDAGPVLTVVRVLTLVNVCTTHGIKLIDRLHKESIKTSQDSLTHKYITIIFKMPLKSKFASMEEPL